MNLLLMLLKGFSLLCLGFGVFVLMQVVMPVLAYKAWKITSFDESQLLADPKPKVLSGNLIGSDVLGISVENINNFPAFVSSNGVKVSPYDEFRISVSSIGLDEKVLVNSNNFELNLSHLPGTSLPGETGNVFITGHSSIWPTFSKKQKALLAKLPGVKKGDQVVVEASGQKFNYEVVGIKIVDPKDVSVINPPDEDGRYLTLMTCVPPGFNTKRLIVLAKFKP
ncbi:class E sortase [Candidatus Daviesbacteria bacterium]|nr:class E sortase [Candidatus Daviesbacteria bacterium]